MGKGCEMVVFFFYCFYFTVLGKEWNDFQLPNKMAG